MADVSEREHKGWQYTTLTTTILSLFGVAIWFFSTKSYEPLIAFLPIILGFVVTRYNTRWQVDIIVSASLVILFLGGFVVVQRPISANEFQNNEFNNRELWLFLVAATSSIILISMLLMWLLKRNNQISKTLLWALIGRSDDHSVTLFFDNVQKVIFSLILWSVISSLVFIIGLLMLTGIALAIGGNVGGIEVALVQYGVFGAVLGAFLGLILASYRIISSKGKQLGRDSDNTTIWRSHKQANSVSTEWRRHEIEQWEQPSPKFKPIPFGDKLVNIVAYPGINVPFKKPLFGEDNVPFELNLKHTHNLIRGIEHRPRTYNDLERSAEIRPGAKNAISAYLLLTAGSAHRIVENIEFDGMKIGCLEFYFEGEDYHQIEVILGKNIRDWSYKDPNIVQVVTDPNVKQVWRDATDSITIDMLRVDFPSPPRNVKFFQFFARYESIPPDYGAVFPTIRVCGLTYQIKE